MSFGISRHRITVFNCIYLNCLTLLEIHFDFNCNVAAKCLQLAPMLNLQRAFAVNSLSLYIYMERQLPVISRVKSEARFDALTRFAGQLALCIHM